MGVVRVIVGVGMVGVMVLGVVVCAEGGCWEW